MNVLSSEICISAGSAVRHFLPHAVSCRPDLWVRGQFPHICYTEQVFELKRRWMLQSNKVVTLLHNSQSRPASNWSHCSPYLSRWFFQTPAHLARHPSLRHGCRHACQRKERPWIQTTPASDLSLGRWRVWWPCLILLLKWSLCKCCFTSTTSTSHTCHINISWNIDLCSFSISLYRPVDIQA